MALVRVFSATRCSPRAGVKSFGEAQGLNEVEGGGGREPARDGVN